MKDRFLFAALVFLTCLFLPVSIYTVSAAPANPCSEDIEKFCKDLPSEPTAVIDCLGKHENELSGNCRDYAAKMAGGRAERQERLRQVLAARQACKDDISRLCKDAKPESGGIARCLDEHRDEVTPSCRESMATLKKIEAPGKQN